MIVCLEKPKEATRKLPELISESVKLQDTQLISRFTSFHLGHRQTRIEYLFPLLLKGLLTGFLDSLAAVDVLLFWPISVSEGPWVKLFWKAAEAAGSML